MTPTQKNDPSENDFDQALSRRLAKLSTLPVDTSRLDRALREQIGLSTAKPAAWNRYLRPFAAIAASLILIAIVGFALLQNRPAQASTDVMLQMHRDIVANKITTMKVDSIAEVNTAFAAFQAGMPKLNEIPEAQAMSCCMQDVGNRKVGCVLLNNGTTPVTLTMADLDVVKPLTSEPVMHNGEAFHVRTSADLNMVTVDRGQHRICLIGAMPTDKLIALTDSLKF